jgi:hypothetical protein
MAQRTDAPRARFGAWLNRFGFWCSIIAGVVVAALILGATWLALFGGTPGQWLVVFLAVGPLVGLLLANMGSGLNYYGIWRVVRGLEEYSARDDALTGGAGAMSNLQGAPAAARAALGCGSLFSVGILTVSLLTAALSYLPAPLPHIGAGLPGGAPTATQIASQPTPTPFPTPTTAPSPTPTPLPTATPSATPSATPIPFQIDGANAFSPASFSGLCSSTRSFSINGVIYALSSTPGGRVTYRWARSDGSFGPAQTIVFAAGETARDVTDSWTLQAAQGTGAQFTDQIQVSAPNAWFSTRAAFTFGCAFVALSASASMPTPSCSDTQVDATGIITFSPSPGGTVTYQWARNSDPPLPPQTITLQPGATSATVTDSWSLPDSAQLNNTDVVMVTAPNAITSNQATFTYDCGD